MLFSAFFDFYFSLLEMNFSIAVVSLPLIAAILYAIASLFLQRASRGGVGPWRTTFFSNLVLGIFFIPWFISGYSLLPFHLWYQPIICGALFFGGQLFGILAFDKGNISIATPVMGTKVIFMALISAFWLKTMPTLSIWIACFLTTIGIFFLRGNNNGNVKDGRIFPSFIFAMLTALFFGLSDLLFQDWARDVPAEGFAPTMFMANLFFSFFLIPFFTKKKNIQPVAWKHLFFATLFIGIQTIAIAYTIATYGQAILVNIFFASRGIWSILAVLFIGKYMNITEVTDPKTLTRRLIGASLLLAAIIIALVMPEG